MAKYLAETEAASLGTVMEHMTVVLFDFRQQKDQVRRLKAIMTAIKEKHKPKKKK